MVDLLTELRDLEAQLVRDLEIVRLALAMAEAADELKQEEARGGSGGLLSGQDSASAGFVIPRFDDLTGEPCYEPRVVAGFGNMRGRAYAAATVYGRRLREVALAQAIFETGETRAPHPTSARWSLGTLTRMKGEWIRDKGYLVYLKDLEPDVDFIRTLYRELGGAEYLAALEVAAPDVAALEREREKVPASESEVS